MAYARTDARNEVKVILIADADDAPLTLSVSFANIITSRVYPTDKLNLPHVAISTIEENIDEDRGTMSGKKYRELLVAIEIRAKKTTGLDTQMDAYALEIEKLMVAAPTLNGKAKSYRLQSTDIEMDAEAEQLRALMTMVYRALYRVARTDPSTLIS